MLRLIPGTPAFAAFAAAVQNSGVLMNREDAAGDTLFLARELEQVSAKTYDVLQNPIIARTLIPFVAELQDGEASYSYDMYDGFASADWISDWSNPVGSADVFKTRFTHTPRSFGSNYSYSLEDIATSTFAGRSLPGERARMTRIAHEQFLENLIAFGDTVRGIKGVANNSNIPLVAPAVGTWDSSTTALELMSDLDKLAMAPELASKQRFVANRMVLPLSVKSLLVKPFSTLNGDSVSKIWLAKQPANGIKSIDYWHQLDTASASTGPRGLAWFGSPDVLRFVYAYDYRELPVQAKGYAFQVLTMAKVLGVITVYPFGAAYMDLDATP